MDDSRFLNLPSVSVSRHVCAGDLRRKLQLRNKDAVSFFTCHLSDNDSVVCMCVCSDSSAKTTQRTSTPDISRIPAKCVATWLCLKMYGFQDNCKKTAQLSFRQ